MSEESLLRDLTIGYEPPRQSWVSPFLYDPNRPIFTLAAVEPMRCDPRVRLARALLAGPIQSNSKFYVDCPDPRVKQFVAAQIQRLWRCVDVPLAAMDYGWQPAEILYRMKDGLVQFDTLRFIHPNDARPYLKNGRLVGMGIKSADNYSGASKERFVPCNPRWPKTYWGVHNRRESRWFGESRYRGAFCPWYEKWAHRGYRDQRQLWFFKCAFQGPTIYHPEGSIPTGRTDSANPLNVETIDNKVLAQKIGDKWASGCTVAIPRKSGLMQGSSPDWELIQPVANDAPQGLLGYGVQLDDEILEGFEILPEMVHGGSGGGEAGGVQIGGAGGRDIPQQAFYSILQGILQPMITDFDEQCIAPLVSIVFGPDIKYEIECFGLLRDDQTGQSSEQMNSNANGESTVVDDDGDGVTNIDDKANDDPEAFSAERGVIIPFDRRERRRLRKLAGYSFSVVGESA